MAFKESHTRSISKALSWRITGSLATSVIAFALTSKLDLAIIVGAAEFVSKIGLFFAHERVWNKINFGRKEVKPIVIWLTGLSGAGKSTVAEALVARLKKMHLKVEHLDGDSVRDIFPKTGFSKAERDDHIRRIGFLASRLERNGVIVVASFISPYKESRDFVRSIAQNFFEVYISTPLEICEQRDPKGLYKKVRRNEIKNFTGIDDPYEAPVNPELKLNTAEINVDQAVTEIVNKVKKNLG